MSRIPVTVLLTTGGGPGILAQVEALKTSTRYDARVLLSDANAASGNLFLPEVDGRWRIPMCVDPDFIPALVRLIKAEGISYLYSGLDEEMPVLARNRTALEAAGCTLLLPPAEALDLAWDKEATQSRLANAVRIPRWVALDDQFDADQVWEQFSGQVIVKVVASRGGRHIHIPEDREEFDFILGRVRRLSATQGLRFLVQEFIEGDEFNVSSLHDLSGRLIYAVSRRKFETRKIKSTTTAAMIERNDAVIAQALEAVAAIGLTPGFNNVEIIVSRRDGLPYFIEINGGRTAAQDLNLVAAGINLTDLMIDIASGAVVDPIPHPADGLACLKIRRDVIVTIADIEAVPAP